jgi:hypothetical protein
MCCQRCHGLMIRDSFVDLRDGGLSFDGWRCINCGEVLDSLVLTHRTQGPTEPYRGRTRDRRMWERVVTA